MQPIKTHANTTAHPTTVLMMHYSGEQARSLNTITCSNKPDLGSFRDMLILLTTGHLQVIDNQILDFGYCEVDYQKNHKHISDGTHCS